jgi:biopolymer transport protein ExbD
MTPMIDIVFLLIIFFMTVSQITRTIDHPLPLPRVVDGDADLVNSSVTINIDAEGNIIIGSKQLSLINTISVIKTRLKKAGDDPTRVKIQIRCDRNCPSKYVSSLLTKLSNLGFNNVRSAVAD